MIVYHLLTFLVVCALAFGLGYLTTKPEEICGKIREVQICKATGRALEIYVEGNATMLSVTFDEVKTLTVSGDVTSSPNEELLRQRLNVGSKICATGIVAPSGDCALYLPDFPWFILSVEKLVVA